MIKLILYLIKYRPNKSLRPMKHSQEHAD